jgi:hypothetical protein
MWTLSTGGKLTVRSTEEQVGTETDSSEHHQQITITLLSLALLSSILSAANWLTALPPFLPSLTLRPSYQSEGTTPQPLFE